MNNCCSSHVLLAELLSTQPLARDILTLPAAAARAIEVEQGAGELLFVPSGWYHQVRGRGGQG